MGEIMIEATCFKCEMEFDDSYDTEECSVCGNEFCDGCQEEHAVEHCFENKDAVKGKKKKK